VLGGSHGYYLLAGVAREPTGSCIGGSERERFSPPLQSRLLSHTYRSGERTEANGEHSDAPYKKEGRSTIFTPSYKGKTSGLHEGSIAAHARAETASGISEKTPRTDPVA
jgi:hypothetical protein